MRDAVVSATSQVPSRLWRCVSESWEERAGSRLTAKVCGSLSQADVGVETWGVWNMVTSECATLRWSDRALRTE